MRTALATLALLIVAACGGGSDDPEPKAKDSPSATPSPTVNAEHEETCVKLGRTWLVDAKKLVTNLYLAVPVDDSTSAMTDATEQMEIEGCEGEIQDAATEGNYEAARISAAMLACGMTLDCGEKAGKDWEAKGFPLMLKVASLTQ